MTSQKTQPLEIDPQLTERLSLLAEREGVSLPDLTDRVLKDHVEQVECALAQAAEDSARWQRYLQTGTAVPFQTIRHRLRHLAADALDAEPR
ncbi:hypothetical protein [Aurantimonas sp. VKM B-3413]|uniref:hypothetical protein n=1 Tax=Aurantimonas sp. VKM B-3413 TaxID=2779401 RepID=UPI001E3F6FE3|nr:hypothetical protein [Aurantimonas sp. VKM B-3413]MCB8839649.1 hypothetical protein [Aurantimonas sp. VKM B-3413]